MSSGQIENKILDAIQTVVDNAVAKANYDKTIQATIVKCANEASGKYVVKYQDSLMYAYSANLETSYAKGATVYVLIPGNDTGLNKQIIGTVSNLGTDYITVENEEDRYELIGNNCSSNTAAVFEMCSYTAGGEEIVLYDKDNSINKIGLNTTAADLYIKNAEYLTCGAYFQTNLNLEQQFAGNYGIAFDLVFADNAEGLDVKKTYVVDINQMSGNPYQLTVSTKQTRTFDIDGVNFKYINKIYIFEKDFPNVAKNKPTDIFISQIQFCGANLLETDADSNCSLSIITPEGIYFDDTYEASETISLQAQTKVRGSVVDTNSDLLKYYWFKENNSITYTSDKYNRYGGQGWECLNDYTIDADTIVWTPGKYNYTIAKYTVPAQETSYKCVVVYNGVTKLSKTVTIYNYSSQYEITIESSDGTQFYYDIGTPTLTCYVNGEEKIDSDYSYSWSVVDSYNDFYSLADDSRYTVNNNKVNNLAVSTINNYATFKCAVSYKNSRIGTGSITIKNSLEGATAYALLIDNGDQIFKYNEKGISPANKSLDNPIDILPLGITLFDDEGTEVGNEAIGNRNIKWIVPTYNTMIDIPTEYGEPTEVDEVNHTATYENLYEIGFTINSTYNIKYTNNTITAIVYYKNKRLVAKTNLSFLKEGEMGTNGTNFACKIVPNAVSGSIIPDYTILTYNESAKTWSLNYQNASSKNWFNVELWQNGENIFTGTKSSEDETYKVTWEMLKSNYDNTNFAINSSTGEITFDPTDYAKTSTTPSPANIIKCTVEYEGMTYYATMPIILSRITNSNYKINLVEDTGFLYAMYTTDGVQPLYDSSNPFELKVENLISGQYEDITLEDTTNYDWNILGDFYLGKWQSETNLIKRIEAPTKNKKAYKPVDSCNGMCLTNAVYVRVTYNGLEIGSIHIPVHLYLNRYGNAAMNGWDGNNISIDDEGGVILAPQIGAGKKNEDNSFTGVFMGTVAEAGATDTETGLFGYNAGERTITLDAENGSAKFGKTGKGQIVLVPDTEDGHSYLKSGTYIAPEIDEYGNVTKAGEGLEIDLTEPSITFGTGNFRVTKEGNVYAAGFATIENLENGEYTVPQSSVDGLETTLADIEESIKYLEVFPSTQTITFTTNTEFKPITSSTNIITYKATFKGKEISATCTLVSPESGITNLEITPAVGKITFKTTQNKALPDSTNKATFDFSYTIEKVTYHITKDIYIVLNIVGDNGVSVSKITEYYNSSVSPKTYDEKDWTEVYPGWAYGKYIWTKSIITYSDSTTTETTPICVSGEDGKGIKETIIEYATTTSATEKPTTGWSTDEKTPAEGEYLWIRTTIKYEDTTREDSISYTVSYRAVDGKGISNSAITYLVTADATTVPSDDEDWKDTFPTVTEDQYLWSRTIVTYTDETKSRSYTVSRAGSTGKNGIGITKVDVEYAKTDSYQIAPTTGWDTKSPDWENGKYIWSRTVSYYTEGDPSYSEPVCISGQRGNDGTSVTIKGSYDTYEELIKEHPTGEAGDSYIIGKNLYIWSDNDNKWTDVGQIEGSDGKDGQTSYMHIKYSDDAGATFTLPPTIVSRKAEDWEVGNYKVEDGTKQDYSNRIRLKSLVDITPGAIYKYNTNSNYRFVMRSYDKDGIFLRSYGDIGTSSSWTAKTDEYKISITIWSYDESILPAPTVDMINDGTIRPTFCIAANYIYGEEPGDYLGQYVDFVATDSTDVTKYTWKLIKGNGGVGISDVTEYYLISDKSSGVTISTQGWSEQIPTMTKEKPYLWNYEKVIYTDTSYKNSTPKIIGMYGEVGRGITSIQNYYLASTKSTGVTVSGETGWTTTVQSTDTTKKYLWNYEAITYTDSTTPENTSPAIIGMYSKDGKTYYTYIKYSATNDSTTGYTDTPDDTTRFIGIKTAETEPTTKDGYNWSKYIGDSITSTSIQYAVSNSGSEKPAETAWSSTMPTDMVAGQFLWTRTTIEYKDSDNEYIYSVSMLGNNADSIGVFATNYDTITSGDAKIASKLYIKGIQAMTSQGRGHTVYKINKSTLEIEDYKVYDDYSAASYATDAATYINSLTDCIVVVLAADACQVNGTLRTALASIGGKSTGTWTAGRYSHYVIGMPGLEPGQGYEDYALNKNFTITVPIALGTGIVINGEKGDTGDTGESISTITEYYLATNLSSEVTYDTEGWTTEIQTVTKDNKYLWNYEIIIGDKSTEISKTTPIIIGVYGETGATGTSIAKVEEEFAISSSKTTAPAESAWSTTPPTWEAGKYLWNRTKITYKDPTSIAYTTAYCDSSWEAVNNIKVGGRNLLLNTANISLETEDGASGTMTGKSFTLSSFATKERLVGQQVTLSCDVVASDVIADSSSGAHRYGIEFSFKTEDGNEQWLGAWKTAPVTNQNGRIYVTGTVPSNWNGILGEHNMYIQRLDSGSKVKLYNAKLELGNIMTEWSPAPEDVETDYKAYADAINLNLQTQIDGQVITWFYSGEPTASNKPASDWTTDELKLRHVGDYYYDNSTGNAYQYSSSYTWTKVSSAVAAALSTAQGAQDTADSKRRVFTSTPSGDVDEGDLWTDGSDLKVYDGSNWVLATDYTDLKLGDIYVGGTNLLKNSNFYNGFTNWTVESGSYAIETNNVYGHHAKITITGGSYRIYDGVNNVWEKDQIYSYSFYAKADSTQTIKPSRSLIDYGQEHTLSTTWARYTGTITSTETVSAGTLSFTFANKDVATYIANVKLEKGNIATQWSPSPEDIQAQSNKIASDLATLTTKQATDVADLQKQIDGVIMDYFLEGIPTPNKDIIPSGSKTNASPADEWTTAAEKTNHIGDLYYDTDTNYCYRWMQDPDNTDNYYWSQVSDSAISEAMQKAQNAYDLADGKRRVFYTQPTPPYDQGDLWVQGENGEILRCQTAKAEGASYSASDWVKASKYTDDSLATTANEKIDNLEIGGRNLVLKSSDFKKSSSSGSGGVPNEKYWSINSAWTITDYNSNTKQINCSKTDTTSNTWSRAIPHQYLYLKDINNNAQGISVSFDLMIDDIDTFKKYSVNGVLCALQVWNSANSRIGWYESANLITGNQYAENINNFTSGVWKRAKVTFTQKQLKTLYDSSTTEDDISYTNISFQLVRDGSIHIKNVKMEWGNKSTDWTPAPEDAVEAVEAAQTTADSKRTVYTGTTRPTAPYVVGDLWTNGNDLYVCTTARTSGGADSDWTLATDYTDIDSIKVGGRNLLLKSSEFIQNGHADGLTDVINSDGSLSVTLSEDNDNGLWYRIAHTFTDTHNSNTIISNNIKKGDPFTISFTMKSTDSTTAPTVYLQSGLGYYAMKGTLSSDYSTIYYSGIWNIDTLTTNVHLNFKKAGTYTIKNAKFEIGNIPTGWTPAPEDAVEEYTNYYSTLTNKTNSLQTQLDSQISSWYYAVTPTLDNAPASSWTTTELKDAHVGDYYFNTADNKAYEFTKSGTDYSWTETTSVVASALAAAAQAQDTADGKRTTYYSSTAPTGTIDNGDLWSNGTDLKIYNNGSWILATDYTNFDLNDISIGSSNIIQESGAFETDATLKLWTLNGGKQLGIATEDNVNCLHAFGSIVQNRGYTLEWNTEYVWHAYVKFVDVGGTMLVGSPLHYWIAGTNTYNGRAVSNSAHDVIEYYVDKPKNYTIVANTWHHLVFRFKTKAKMTDYNYVTFTPFFYGGIIKSSDPYTEYFVKWAQLEKGNVPTDWKPAQEDYSTKLSNAVTVLNGDLADLQSQVDGQVITWFYSGTPTLSNEPASNWTSDETKNAHLGDYYYDNATGNAYKFILTDTTYSWSKVSSAVATALSTAQGAQTTANSKRRVFTTTPTTPYEVGDLWTNKTDLYVCNVARSSGSYTASDWVLATNYTDLALSDINISGRNLLLNTKKIYEKLRWQYSGSSTTTYEQGTYLSNPSIIATHTYDSSTTWCYVSYPFGKTGYAKLKANTDYVLSFDIKTDVQRNVSFTLQTGDTKYVASATSNTFSTKANEWCHAILKTKTKSEIPTGADTTAFYVYFSGLSSSGVYEIANIKLEEGNVPTIWTEAPEDIEEEITANAKEFTDFVNTTYTNAIKNLQEQIDGEITTWFYNEAPTLENEPAKNWTDDATKRQHIGDLYYDQKTGLAYRFVVSDAGVFSWSQLSDSAVAKALADAAKAQDTADNKRRVFYETPTPPYDKCDLWMQGSTGDIYICQIAKASGTSYSANDWVKASKYTDNTLAQSAKDAADAAQEDIDNLEIGGRNLWIGSKNISGYSGSSSSASNYTYNNTDVSVPSTKYFTFDLASGSTSNFGGPYFTYAKNVQTLDRLESGEIYTISFYIKAKIATTIVMGNVFESQTKIATSTNEVTTEWTRLWATYKWTSTSKNTPYFYCYLNADSTNTIYISSIKIEKGNRATDWTEAPEDTQTQIDDLNDDFDTLQDQVTYGINEVIVGTQTAATGSWTGTSSFAELRDGQQITYWLPYNGSGNATLQLTLSGGSTTSAIPCYYGGTTRLTTHYGAGNAIHLTYRKNVTIGTTTIAEGWWADANYNTDNNTYDRTRFNQAIKAVSAISSGQLIGGISTGYKPIVASTAYDLDKPILWAGSAIAVNGTGSNNYLNYPSCNIQSTISGLTLTQYETCYLKGALSGNTFTTSASPFLVTTKPTSADGYTYMSLGYMSSTTNMILYPEHPLYKYVDGSFKSLNQVAYEAQNDIDNLNIGGRNLILNSNFAKGIVNRTLSTESGWVTPTSNTVVNSTITMNGHNTLYRYRTGTTQTSWTENQYYYYRDEKQQANDITYTLRYWVYTENEDWLNVTTNTISCAVRMRNASNASVGEISLPTAKPTAANVWQERKTTFTIPASKGCAWFYFFDSPSRDFDYYLADYKLEIGNVATDWSLAPEDDIAHRCRITPSNTVFKSIDGKEGVYTPSAIVLTPSFNQVSFSKWYYSDGTLNDAGKITWTEIVPGTTPHIDPDDTTSEQVYDCAYDMNLTVTSHSLIIPSNCGLFTDTTTEINFKCESTETAIFDAISINKTYEGGDLVVGTRNYVLDSKAENNATCDKAFIYEISDDFLDSVIGKYCYLSFNSKKTTSDDSIGLLVTGSVLSSDGEISTISMATISALTDDYIRYSFKIPVSNLIGLYQFTISASGSNLSSNHYYIEKIQLEVSDICTDWGYAPEDVENVDATTKTYIAFSQYCTYNNFSKDSSVKWYEDYDGIVGNTDGLYQWTKTITTYSDGRNATETLPICGAVVTKEYTGSTTYYMAAEENKYTAETASKLNDSYWTTYLPAWGTYADSTVNYVLWVKTRFNYVYGNTGTKTYTDSTPYVDTEWVSSYYLNKAIKETAEKIDALQGSFVEVSSSEITVTGATYDSSGKKIKTNNVMKIDSLGIRFSQDGGTTWKNAWNIDGSFVTNKIATSALLSQIAQGGNFKLGGDSFGEGQLSIYGESQSTETSQPNIYIDSSGLHISTTAGGSIDIDRDDGIKYIDSSNNNVIKTDESKQLTSIKNIKAEESMQYGTTIKVIQITSNGHNGIAFIASSE